MFDKPFSLRIISPDRVVFEGEAVAVSAAGAAGGFQVLYNHAPLLSSLLAGPLKVKSLQGDDALFATGGGFLEVHDNNVVVLVESAELPGDIDVKRAEASRDRAIQRLRSNARSTDVARAEASLQRALNRLHLAGRH
jgi:F-type H+-transporting ATPase subunit epsilon